MKSWPCTSCAIIPISLRVFPPLAKGGSGGVVSARSIAGSAMGGWTGLSERVRASERRPEASKTSALADAVTPLGPPFARGGKGGAALVLSEPRSAI
jgi:hypothetical protein